MKEAVLVIMIVGVLTFFGWFYYDCTNRGGTPVRGLFVPVTCIGGK